MKSWLSRAVSQMPPSFLASLYMKKCLWVPVAGLFGLIPVMVDGGLLALAKRSVLILDNNKLLWVIYSILPVFLVSSPALLLKDILPL